MISTYETYVSSGCEVSQNINALPNVIFPHIFCAHLNNVEQQVQFEKASFHLKQSWCLPADQFQLLVRCYLPLVFDVIMSEYLCHDRGKSQLFFSGRISEQVLL